MMCKKIPNLMVAADVAVGPTAKNNSSKITHIMKNTEKIWGQMPPSSRIY